uniref:TRE17 protein n=1 Tax=Homo sapiens TaxID=9606 RepID=Q9H3W2_HUMAN|nr:TRE17 protein [Homo sapiens]
MDMVEGADSVQA